ncbi:MAG TPA: DUF1761 domain-containing protein [Caulobacteraceae bacterium]
MKGINWAGVVAAVIVGQVIGFLWYGLVFEQQWLALTGITPNADAANMSMALGAVNQLVVAIGLAWLVNKLGAATLMGGATAGLAAGFFFAATTAAQNFIYAGADTGLIPIDIGYLLVVYTVMGAVIGAVKLGARSAAAA